MPTPVQRYYPNLAELVSLDDFPEKLEFVKDGITAVFSKIYYKDLQFSKSASGESAFFSLKIVSNDRIDFEIPGTGVSVVINPDDDDELISSFALTVEYHWQILAIIHAFDVSSFSEGVDALAYPRSQGRA